MDPLMILNLVEAGFSVILSVINELKSTGIIPGTSPVHAAAANMTTAIAAAKADAAAPAAP
jgi:hypothetical protein